MFLSESITQAERRVYDRPFNLTDGHLIAQMNNDMMVAVERFPEIYNRATRCVQDELELSFVREFASVNGQRPEDLKNVQFCSSASSAIEIVANVLRVEDIKVHLIEPCFDNIADILRRNSVQVEPVSEGEVLKLATELYQNGDQTGEEKALFLVLPNNPTGWSLSEKEFRYVSRQCAESGSPLIVDFSFRPYSDMCAWDQYTILNEEGVEYLAIEDTGKTWPTRELKIGLIVSSSLFRGTVDRIHSDFVLKLSPVLVKLLTEIIRRGGFEWIDTLRNMIAENRGVVRKRFREMGLVSDSYGKVPVEWMRSKNRSGVGVARSCMRGGVNLLPGDRFFWSRDSVSKHIRISLARETKMIESAMDRLSGTASGD